jgi:hypothetical protein
MLRYAMRKLGWTYIFLLKKIVPATRALQTIEIVAIEYTPSLSQVSERISLRLEVSFGGFLNSVVKLQNFE